MDKLIREHKDGATRKSVVAALALVGACLWGSSAAAAPLCFPAPVSVPGLTGSPQWFNETNSSSPDFGDAVRTDLNEPRWGAGAPTDFSNDSGNTSTNNGDVRVVASADGSELSISVQSTTTYAAHTGDYVAVGFWVPPASGSGNGTGVAAMIPLAWGSTDPFVISNNQVSFYTYGGGTSWSSLFGAASWIESGSIASWANQPVTAGGADWAVQFKVQLGQIGITPGTAFKMFLGLTATDGTGHVELFIPNHPSNAPVITGTTIPNDPTSAYWYSAPAVSAGCQGGVAFTSPMQIGTTNSDSSLISNASGVTNSFYATPTVPSSLSIPPGSLVAKFQIANWGAQIADPAAPWTTILNGAAVSNAASANGSVAFNFSCPTNTTTSSGTVDVCGAPQPTGSLDDQCMLVTLSDAPLHPNGTPITTASVYRNMRFGTLSSKTFPADISIKGLQAITGVPMDRDVYIKIATRNMPPLGNWPLLLDSTLMNLLKSALLGFSQAVNPLSESLSLDQQMKVVWPTYEVHVFYDTGTQHTVNGDTYEVLSPMNSFGYYLSHDGVFYGFTTATASVGTTALTPLGTAGDSFKVRIPNESSIRINNGVSADEVPAVLVPLQTFACELWPWAC